MKSNANHIGNEHAAFFQQHNIFDALVNNAFDFLQKAINEFDAAPKYSVIHFCAAVEMLLKARLMREHWSLIVSRPENANWNKFLTGDFMSVTMDDARARLRDIAGEEIPDDAFNSFRVLANHRNKMIHFFHPDMDEDGDARAKIVAEQSRSWFYLHRLLHRWRRYFSEFSDQIAEADGAMKAHRKYLTAKFKALKPELDAARKDGSTPIVCVSCNFKSSIPMELDNQIATLGCLVCDHSDSQVTLDCPHCAQQIVVTTEGYAECPHCEAAIEPEHLADALTDHGRAHSAFADGDDSWNPANCGACDGYQTVVKRDDYYFCTSCFDMSDEVHTCGWCNELNTGDMQYSYSTGCNHCDGSIGWDKDN